MKKNNETPTKIGCGFNEIVISIYKIPKQTSWSENQIEPIQKQKRLKNLRPNE